MGRDGRDTVYCNTQMPLAKGRDLVRLVTELRAAGTYPDLASVFEEIQGELEMPIEFVEEMLTGGSFDQHRH